MMRAYGITMDDMVRRQQSNEMSKEINRMINSLINEK